MIRSDDARGSAAELVKRARRSFRVSEKTLARMSERGEPDGLLALVEMPQWSPEQIDFGASALVLVTDGIEIPGNLGTLIRTLNACKADLLIMTNRRTRMSHPKVLRGSQGMSLVVPHIEFQVSAARAGPRCPARRRRALDARHHHLARRHRQLRRCPRLGSSGNSSPTPSTSSARSPSRS